MEIASEGASPVDRTREINGQPSHFLEGGAGPTLFFVHDWLSTAVSFAALVHELGPRYRRIRVDLPGFGGTPAPEDWDHTLGSYAAFLNASLRETASRDATLVCHGFGTLVTLRALADDGGEASRRVSRLILLNGPLYDEAPKGVFSFLKKGPFEPLLTAPPHDLPTYRRRMLRLFGDPTYFDEAFVEEAYERWRPGGPATLRSLAEHLPQLRESLPRLRGVLQHWTGPVHLLWGEEDPFAGAEPAHRFHEEVRRAKVLIFPEVGYLPHVEAPKAVANQIRKVVRVSKVPSLPTASSKTPASTG